MTARRALITGITGQDGSYLAELLAAKGYEVHGIARSGPHHRASLGDAEALAAIVAQVKPDEFYHLAAQTFVGTNPIGDFETFQSNATGTFHVLESLAKHAPRCRLFLAGTAEMFGEVAVSPQNEDTPLCPRSMYGVSKVAAYHMMRLYRSAHGMHASCGILYNHESPRRGQQFVSRKIASAAAAIKTGAQSELRLGNLDAVRDWGHAKDFVKAMWLMLQQDQPGDFVLATGTGHTVQDFVEAAFGALGLHWQDYVAMDPNFYRPAEKVPLVGSPAKAEKSLAWKREYDFESLVREMMDYELTIAAAPR